MSTQAIRSSDLIVNADVFTKATSRFASGSKAARWGGRFLSGFVILFMTFDGAIKLTMSKMVVDGTTQLGFSPSLIIPIGIIALVCTALYAIPRTSAFGALLLTGYLGGAIASQLRIGSPLFGYTLFPIYVALMIWGGLYLRDERVRAVFSLRRNTKEN